MGKRRIEIKKIEDRQKRDVAFTKRRHGLFKKAADLCRLTGADISLASRKTSPRATDESVQKAATALSSDWMLSRRLKPSHLPTTTVGPFP
ncbi:hypothetical protein C5167_002015 [Papaver somniferum]|uniref:MADS-box domain-containing protein n=1 Tax=Papaver somniferum TaxID=3469 RepID=A0A4Y7KWS6_PAPSO|nr:hypothetical protein C5167_002015 [Papaver somniferum]